MFAQVTAKNVGVFFLRYSVFDSHDRSFRKRDFTAGTYQEFLSGRQKIPHIVFLTTTQARNRSNRGTRYHETFSPAEAYPKGYRGIHAPKIVLCSVVARTRGVDS